MPSTTAQPILQAHALRKTYRMGRVDVPVLKGASIDVHEGEWVAVLGASGSGKSTLLHLMGDLDQPDTPGGGFVRFERHMLAEMHRRDRNVYRNRTIGFVFQFYHLLPELNVLENTILPGLVGMSRLRYWRERGPLRARATELLDSFGLGHRLKHRPRELSGGERQRVAIARALLNKPRILLADEPTGNLDEDTGRDILDLIASQHREGLTIVMVTHDRSIAERANRIVELHGGQVVEQP
ncbi:MAG TPA: ABC transporter ATP-binding protein [Phycisphaerales bacterium]|nr:ABC transporter ATP-binding protein [Phycisphaerales bacterium]